MALKFRIIKANFISEVGSLLGKERINLYTSMLKDKYRTVIYPDRGIFLVRTSVKEFKILIK